MFAKRLISAFGALATVATSAALAAESVPAKAPSKIDDLTCFLYLDFYVFAAERKLKEGKISGAERDQVVKFVARWRIAQGFFEGRLDAQPPADFAGVAAAATKRMQNVPVKELADTAIECLKYYDTQHSSTLKSVFGPGDPK